MSAPQIISGKCLLKVFVKTNSKLDLDPFLSGNLLLILFSSSSLLPLCSTNDFCSASNTEIPEWWEPKHATPHRQRRGTEMKQMKYVINYNVNRTNKIPSLWRVERKTGWAWEGRALWGKKADREKTAQWMSVVSFLIKAMSSHIQTITKPDPNVYMGCGVGSRATWQEKGGNRGGRKEVRNGAAPLQRFLNDFQRPTSQITETKTTLTPGRAIRKTCFNLQ